MSASLETQRQSLLMAEYPAIAGAFLFSDFSICPGKKAISLYPSFSFSLSPS